MSKRPVKTWGGRREGAGRPRTERPRCACGKLTAARAKARYHVCEKAA